VSLRRRALLACSVMAATACAAPPATDVELPVGKTWAWVGTDAGGARRNAPGEPARYTITLEPTGRATLRLDCNRGSAQWHQDGGRLVFSPIAATKMMCPRGSLDVAFASDLTQVEAWRVDAGALVLTGRDGSTMRFRPAAP
jgi:heat shock protein HslJ